MLVRNMVAVSATAIAAISFSAPAAAQVIVVNEASHVRYSNTGGAAVNGNNLTGISASATPVYDSGFIFSTAGAQRASAISITFAPRGSFMSDVGSETLGLFDYTGNITQLANGTGGVAAYNDLNSGQILGSYTLTAANSSAMPSFTVQLSQSFVDQYNSSIGSADQRVALGAAITTLSGSTPSQSFWFSSLAGNASALNVQLAAAAPEPSAWGLLTLGFGVVGGAMRRRKRAISSTLLT